jgi:hypothetical protein
MHILVHIFVSYAMLNNIFAHLNRISRNIARGYQLVYIVFIYSFQVECACSDNLFLIRKLVYIVLFRNLLKVLQPSGWRLRQYLSCPGFNYQWKQISRSGLKKLFVCSMPKHRSKADLRSLSHRLWCRCVSMWQGFKGFLDLWGKIFSLSKIPGGRHTPSIFLEI